MRMISPESFVYFPFLAKFGYILGDHPLFAICSTEACYVQVYITGKLSIVHIIYVLTSI